MSSSGPIISGIAGRYASALFELADEARQIESVGKNLLRFDALVTGSADLTRLIKSPSFTADEQVSAVTALLSKAKRSEERRVGKEC